MSADFNYLEDEDFNVIRKLFTSGKLEYNSAERKAVYLNGVSNEFRTTHLETNSNQIVQLDLDMSILSQTPRLIDGSVPIRQWMKRISGKLGPLPEKEKIDAILEKVEEKIKIIEKWGKSNDDPTAAQVKTLSLFQEVGEIKSEQTKNPFLGSESYSTEFSEIFFGRKNETEIIVDKIIDGKKSIALFGKPFTGKTSLINSGIIPELKEKYENCRILKIENYEDVPASIKDAVQALPVNYKQTLRGDPISNVVSRPMVIIFDQFERVCDYLKTDEEKKTLLDSFKKIFFEKNLQVIIAYRDDEPVIRLIADINFEIDNKIERYSGLKEFTTEEAVEVVKLLLNKTDFILDETFFATNLINDCTDLGRDRESVNPQLLQIICKKFHESAENLKDKTISPEFYMENRSPILLSRHLEDILGNDIRDSPAIASKILAYFIIPGNDSRATFEKLREFTASLKLESQDTKENLSDETLEKILEDLQRLKLIIKQERENGAVEYHPPFPFYAKDAQRITKDPNLLKEFLAKESFNFVWIYWKEKQNPISQGQLESFEEIKDKFKPEQALFLLRSAVENNRSVDYWLESLKENNGQELIKKLQNFDSSADGSRTLDDFEAAVNLFMEPSESGSENPDNSENWLSERAVMAENLAIRQTAVLALTLEAGDEGFDLKTIVKFGYGFWQRLKRRSELAGTLLEYLPRDKTNNLKLSVTDRLLAWRWRVNRRMRQDGLPINSFLKYSALYGGLIFGVSKLGVFLSEDGISFITFFNTIVMLIVGAILAWFVAKGMLWARYSFVIFSENTFANSSRSNNRCEKIMFANSLVIAVGALCFGLFNSLSLHLLSDLTFFASLLVIGLGFIAGIGIGLGLYIKSKIFEDKIFGWIIGLLVTVMFFIAVQSIFAFGCENKWGLFLTPDTHSLPTITGKTISLIYAFILGAYLYLGLGIGEAKVKKEHYIGIGEAKVKKENYKSILFG